MTSPLTKLPVWAYMLFAFGAWLLSFQAYLLAKAPMALDAMAYIVSAQDLVNFIKKGAWPLWDFCYAHGVAFDFFTQRLGGYNPLYSFLALLDATRIFNFQASYVLALSTYYFAGMLGFYFLINKIYTDRRVAFCGFILLLFSSLATTIFSSFLCLLAVPLIWFFYFLTSLLLSPRKVWFSGCILTAMILVNTYVPFYFLVSLMVVTLTFVIVFSNEIGPLIARLGVFFRNNLLFCVLLSILFILALIPPAELYMNSLGNISLPIRYGSQAISGTGAAIKHALTVDPGYVKWGAFEQLIFSSFFTSVARFNFDILFFPLVSLPLLLWGTFCRINKRLIFYILCLLLFLGIGSPRTPIYALFADHLFFFKYFRNLHFFVWFGALPLLALIFADIFHQLLNPENTWHSWDHKTRLLINSAIHLLLLAFLLSRGDLSFLLALTLMASFLFISVLLISPSLSEGIICGGLCLIVLPQAFILYYHLGLKHSIPRPYIPAEQVCQLAIPSSLAAIDVSKIPQRLIPDYYSSRSWADLANNVSGKAIGLYMRSPVIFYDRVQPTSRDRYGFKRIEISFFNNENTAFIPRGATLERLSNGVPSSPHPLRAGDTSSEQLSIIDQSPNHVIFSTDLPADKFMVFNDPDHSQWHVFINGKEETLTNANIAFKGVWVPAGKATVEFRFSSQLWYWFNILLWLAFHGLFIGTCGVLINDRRKGAL